MAIFQMKQLKASNFNKNIGHEIVQSEINNFPRNVNN